MFKNLLKIAFRNITKDLGYSGLNILGLTIGITSALFLILYIADELSYDKYHENAERIYRVSSNIKEPDDQFTWIVAQIPFGPQVKEDYPEVEESVRFFYTGRQLYRYEDKQFFEEDIFYADSNVFRVFDYELLKGNPETALKEPNTIVLTRTLAQRYFGDTDPMGKSLKRGDDLFTVKGVIEDVPKNSHFRFDGLISRSSVPDWRGSWGNFGVFTYILLEENTDAAKFEEKIQEMYDKYMAEIFEKMSISVKYELEQLTNIHLYSKNPAEPEPTGSMVYVYIFGIVAFFLILIASLNYMNLATARSMRRAREVGLRKVVGSQRGSLIFQFLTESVAITIVSLILALILVSVLLPSFNNLASKQFEFNVLFSPVMILSIIGVIVIVGVLGGSYPAFYLSRFNPVKVMKGELGGKASGVNLRKVLVVLQFTISIAMIVSTIVVFSQLNYLQNKELGYNMENVISLELSNRDMIRKYDVLKDKLLDNSDVINVTSSNTRMGEGTPKVIFMMETDDGMDERGINFSVVDHDFVETMEIEMDEGRDFSDKTPSDTLHSVVVNQTLAKRMNWTEPIGKKVELGDENTIRAEVVGVMKDYHQTGMYNETESLMLLYRKLNRIVYVRLSGQNTPQDLRYVEKQWKEIFPDQPFKYTFLEDRFKEQFGADRTRGKIFTIFTILAIVIACLGLFGLASYTVEQRTKEIGIRKVAGATEGVIVRLFSKEFLILILISMIIAFPVSYYFMNDWLQDYVYRIELTPIIFVYAGLLTLVITILTISTQTYKAAIMNPARSLRVE